MSNEALAIVPICFARVYPTLTPPVHMYDKFSNCSLSLLQPSYNSNFVYVVTKTIFVEKVL